MSRVTKAISDDMVAACKAELEKHGISGEIRRRLISAKETEGASLTAKKLNHN